MITIEKNIPIFPHARKNWGEKKRLALEMLVGDSVHYPTFKDARSFAVTLRTWGRAASIRKDGKGYRVWRTR